MILKLKQRLLKKLGLFDFYCGTVAQLKFNCICGLIKVF